MTSEVNPLTLSIDIGGTGLKMLVLDYEGNSIDERQRSKTPHPATPNAVLDELKKLIDKQPAFDRVSIGFPGVIKDGCVKTAVNLDKQWTDFNLAKAIIEITGKPVRIANDADVQGYACIEGRGVELVLTLGTGMGSAHFVDGILVPNLELAHHPYKKKATYEDFVGKVALQDIGKEKWCRRVQKVIEQLEPIWNYRLLHIGGGNVKLLDQGSLPDNVKLHSNIGGVLGGIALWERE